jgi:glycosyltransferase involved in cell wall biosynthesis
MIRSDRRAIGKAVLRVSLVSFASAVGGGEIYLASLARGLDARGVEVRALAASEPLFRRLRELGVDARLAGFPPGHPLQSAAGLQRFLDETRPDLVHYNEPRSMYFHPVRFLGPAVATFHCSLGLVGGLRRFLRDRALRFFGRRMARIICVWDSIRKELDGLDTRLPAVTVENGVDTKRFSPEPYPVAGPATVLEVSRIVPEKGQGDLLEAVGSIPDVRVVLVGEGPAERIGLLRDRARELGVPCRFAGFQKDVGPFYAWARVVALPSRSEGLPLTLLEAMSCARPVVVYDFPGALSLVEQDVNGLVVPSGDVETLAGALRTLLSDPARAAAMGEAGRRTAVNRFSLDRMVDETLAVYRDAMK